MRNHFVPQFLQAPWTSNDGMLQLIRLNDGVSKRRAPKALGFQDDLLSLSRDKVVGMDKHAIETLVLQRVDNDADLVRKKLAAGQLASLTHVERCAWVRFIMSLRLRQPSIVDELRIGSAELLKQKLSEQPEVYQSIAVGDSFPTLESWTEAAFPGLIENFGLSFFHELINDEGIGTKLLRLKWWVWRFGANDHSLLLGDQPCVFAGGIDDPNFAMMLPISPQQAFIATRGETLTFELERANSKVLSRNFNNASVLQAENSVYSVDDRQLRFIQNRRPPMPKRPTPTTAA